MYERAEARIDLGALRHNCRELKSRLSGSVELCPVLKADAYGHGALHCVTAAVEGGADRIAFATASEAALARSVAPVTCGPGRAAVPACADNDYPGGRSWRFMPAFIT